MRKNRYNSSGFSYAEVLVYVGVLAIMTVAVINGLIYLLSTYREFKDSKDLYGSAVSSLERMTGEIREAESINLGESVFGLSPGRLTLNLDSDAHGGTTSEFYLENGRLLLSEDGVLSGVLNASSTVVTNLVFRRITATHSEGIKVEMTIEVGEGADVREETFSATAILRGAYVNQ